MDQTNEPTRSEWQCSRRKLIRQWWIYMALIVLGGLLFLRNRYTNEPTIFALLALIPILGLRGAWKSDRQIVAINRKIAEHSQESASSRI
jgi:cadmium resistance protein CadD (predicted permease)